MVKTKGERPLAMRSNVGHLHRLESILVRRLLVAHYLCNKKNCYLQDHICSRDNVIWPVKTVD